MKGFNYKNIGKKVASMVPVLFIAILLGACSQNNGDGEDKESDGAETYIYYINADETKIIGEAYEPVGTTKEELVEEYLEALSKEPEDYSLKKAGPDNLEAENFSFNENNLSIDFNSYYNDLSGISEVLCRASIVKTLCQIEGVDSVEFTVGGQPVMGLNDKPLRFMESDDFIDDTSVENVYVTVYFSNEKGTALESTDLKITYEGNVPIEKLILERLIGGPEEVRNIKGNMLKTIPDGTELLNVSTKDGICYVDFNEKFLNKMEGIKDEVVIYSIVNSLVELSTINKVQFTINGEIQKNYREGIPFDGLFERNLDLVEGSK